MNDAALIRMRRITLPIKRLPGAVLLLEYVRKYFAHKARTIRVDDFDGNLQLDLRLDEHMQSQIFWYGYYSRDVILAMNRLLRSGMVMLDVGANIGEVSMAAAQRVGYSGHVFAFEPMPSLYEKLSFNLSRNGLTQAKAIRKGLADKAVVAPIYFAEAQFIDGTKHDGLGTLYPTKDRAGVAGEIELTTLDSFFTEMNLPRVDLIKIDVEGAELDVLRGGQQTLAHYRPHLIIEVQNETSGSAGYAADEILSFLEPMGYSFFTIGRNARLRPLSRETLKPFQNVLCVPAS